MKPSGGRDRLPWQFAPMDPLRGTQCPATRALSILAQSSVPPIHPMPGDPSKRWEDGDAEAKRWNSELLDQVKEIEGADWVTARHDFMGVPIPLAPSLLSQCQLARSYIIACPICAEHGLRCSVATPTALIDHLHLQHSCRWVPKELEGYLRKCSIRIMKKLFMRRHLDRMEMAHGD